MACEYPDPVTEQHEGVLVVRDDLLVGGSKVRALGALLVGADEFVYASPAQGYAQLALARVARDRGLGATVFVPQRNELSPVSRAAQRLGARMVSVPAGRLSVLNARARAYCAQTGARQLSFGLVDERMLSGLERAARTIPAPVEAWVAAGSGTLATALARAWPGCAVHAVRVGRAPHVPAGVRLWAAPEPFARPASGPLPPVPSVLEYDAKVWRFVKAHATPGALFWNVAGPVD